MFSLHPRVADAQPPSVTAANATTPRSRNDIDTPRPAQIIP
jgi:hypothetical protein